MNSYVCPRCHTRSQALLREGQVCQTCRSARAWAEFGKDGRIIVIEDVPKHTSSSPAAPVRLTGREYKTMWLTLASACALTLAAAALLFLFLRGGEVTPSEDFFARLNILSNSAAALAMVAVLVSIGSALYVWYKGHTSSVVLRYAGLAVILLSVGISVPTLFFRSKTARIPVLPPVGGGRADATLARLQGATAAIHAFRKDENPYRTVEGMGVVIAAKSGHIWVLTTPYSDKGSWQSLPDSEALWVSLADGRSLRGRVRWAAPPHVNLALIEVEGDAPPGLASTDPVPEGLIPGRQVLSIPNPLRSGWAVQRGQVLTRQSLHMKQAWHCFVQTDLEARPEDIGTGLFSDDGRLLGLNAGFDSERQASRYVIVTSEILNSILASVESGDFDSLSKLSFEVIPS